MIDDHDLIGQLVGLVQVLGGEQQRGAARDQRPDDVPHPESRPRVQAGRWFVEEQDLGPPDQARGQVQAALHAARVGLGCPVRGIAEVELLQELDGAAAGRRPAQVVEAPDDLEVLPAGELLLNGGRLPRQPDRAADRRRLPYHVAALHQRLPAVRQQQRGQDPHGGRLARAVRAEHAENRPARDRQVDSAQRANLPERLDQALHQDRRRRARLCHLILLIRPSTSPQRTYRHRRGARER